jgi:hypothetical protein
MFIYLDAGTGSMIIAAFAGGAAGIGVLIKMYSQRMLGVFSNKHRQQAEETRAQLVGDTTEESQAQLVGDAADD